jgi:SAM-dependent methyltransferase
MHAQQNPTLPVIPAQVPPSPVQDISAIKASQKATWEAGDFGQIARAIEDAAAEFMAGLPLSAGMRVLDSACGTGNLAVHAARAGCEVHGVDIARNLLSQARANAASEGLSIDYREGDVEALPYEAGAFDLVVSMFGVMFAPRPEIVAAELARVTKPGGRIALANWTPQGFVGKTFATFQKHLRKPTGLPSPMTWGEEETVRERLGHGFTELSFTRRIALMRYPFPPAEAGGILPRVLWPRTAGIRRDWMRLLKPNSVETSWHSIPPTTSPRTRGRRKLRLNTSRSWQREQTCPLTRIAPLARSAST